MTLKDKIILVIGGEGLLGKSIINHIKQNEGYAISLDLKNDKTTLGFDKYYFDLNDDICIEKVYGLIYKRFGRVDGLVNNAYPRTEDWNQNITNITNESFSLNLDMQLSRIFAVTKPILDIMQKKKAGSIVNIASIYGIVGNDFTVYKNTNIFPPVAYSAIKGGLINLNRYLASYYGQYNIRLNCVSPGGIFNNQDPTFVKNYEFKVPMKRMGKPDDISPTITFLLSDESKYLTGQNIAIDGGWTCI